MIPEKKQEELKKKLEESKKKLEIQIKELMTEVDMGDDTDHLEEEADETEEATNQFAAAIPLKERLADVESALEKIRTGKYGICEKCGKEIELELLEIDPESRYCRDCKKQI